MQILVLGMHRSGTSMVTRLINMMGAYFGPETSTGNINADNPKGFWERPEVSRLNESLLATQKASWQDLRHFTPAKAPDTPPRQRDDIRKILLGLDAFRPWVLKDPRMCLLLPAWLPYLECPLAVIPYRDPLEIATSLQIRNGLPIPYGLALWETYSIHMLNASVKLPRIHVQHAALLEKPFKTTELLCAKLRDFGVRRIECPSEREIRAFIDPRLYRSRPKSGPELTSAQLLLCDILEEKSPQTALLKISESTKALLQQGPPKLNPVIPAQVGISSHDEYDTQP